MKGAYKFVEAILVNEASEVLTIAAYSKISSHLESPSSE